MRCLIAALALVFAGPSACTRPPAAEQGPAPYVQQGPPPDAQQERAPDRQRCSRDADCTGMLPKLCRVCGDGGTQCARWRCAAGTCETWLCE